MKRCWVLPLVAVIVVSLARCAQAPGISPQTMPDVGVPSDSLNAQIHLWAPQELNSFKINEPINLAVEITGNSDVIFDRDYGNRMFRNAEGTWTEVQNVPTEWGEGSFLLSPSEGDPQRWGTTQVYPWLEGDADSIQLRIFVVGRVIRDGEATDEKVTGFVDVMLKR